MQPEKLTGKGKVGVKVVNLWQAKEAQSEPLIPGWYTLSMEAEKAGKISFTLYSKETGKPKSQFKKTYTLEAKPNERVQLNFMTGYQNYGYDKAPFKLEFHTNSAKNIMIEKTRPLQKASRYGVGSFVDTVSDIAPGERLVTAP